MQVNELTAGAMDDAERAVGNGPIVMVNLLWFRDAPKYPAGFKDAKPNGRSAYYEGYAGAFQTIARKFGISHQLIYVGDRMHGLIAGPDGDWDAIVMVRYERLLDLRKIMEDVEYSEVAAPHRLAGTIDWRFFATRAAAP